MTIAEKHIRRFNLMQGNDVRKDTLQKFLKTIPESPELSKLRAMVTKAIGKLTQPGDIGVLKFAPLKLNQNSATLSGTDDLISGLQNIQNDSTLEAKSLDGIGDTTYKVITDRILELIASGGLIWRQPWNDKVHGDTDLAHNYVTKHIYKGGNYYLNYLRMGFKVKGKLVQYDSPYFFTFKQVDGLGGRVMKGEKGWPVIYFKWLYKDVKKNILVPEDQAKVNGKLKPGYQKIPGLFYYNVFNYQQCEGLSIKTKVATKKTERERIDSAEEIIEDMPKRPVLKIAGNDAWYNRSIDTVQVPPMVQFKKEQHFYSVQFHELIHSTGHKDRVFRERESSRSFGDKNYAFEELIAELGASFLCGESGILYHTMKDSAAYIQGWSKRLKQEMEADPKFFLRAASQAQKASDFILARGEYENLKKKAKAKTPRPAVKRVKKLKPEVKPEKMKIPASVLEGERERSGTKPATALAGFTTADQAPEQPKNLFRLPGVIGELLGEQQRYKLEIVVSGETHSGKSELGKQIADAFISGGFKVGYVDWEQGGVKSKATMASLGRNMSPENRQKLAISPDRDGNEIPRNLDAIKALHKYFDVVVIDSGTKLRMHTNSWIDELREHYPDTIWVILMQQNTKGGTQGGAAAEFDAPVIIKTYRPDRSDFRKNYAVVEKNRDNKTDVHYNIAFKQIFDNPGQK